jgi:hypothetical protein
VIDEWRSHNANDGLVIEQIKNGEAGIQYLGFTNKDT